MDSFERSGTLRKSILKRNTSNDLNTIEEHGIQQEATTTTTTTSTATMEETSTDPIENYCCGARCLKMPRTVVDGPLPCGCWQWCTCECITRKRNKSWRSYYDNFVTFVQTKRTQFFEKRGTR